MKPYSIGITIHVKPDGDLGLFENGLKQNVIFLAKLFEAAPNCERVFLINDGGATPKLPDWLDLKVPIVPSRELLGKLDFVLGVGTSINRDLIDAWRSHGTKVIAYKGGNGGVMAMEGVAARPTPSPDCECYYDRDSFDAVWLTPQHTHTYRSWCETIYRVPVHEIGQVWSPMLLEATKPDTFGYKPGKRPWRIGVMEPNNTVMKTSHMAMLVIEQAYRRRPDFLDVAYICNTLHLKEYESFKTFALALDSVKKTNFEARFVASQFLGNYCDAVVTHQWENELNYLYYDVLWGGYPLIHNSMHLADFGYYYYEFDATAGAKSLLYAVEHHDERLNMDRKLNAKLFKQISPTYPPLIADHERLLRLARDGDTA